jgi:hypothetical protein
MREVRRRISGTRGYQTARCCVLPAYPWSIPWDLILVVGRVALLVFSFLTATVAFTRWRRAAECDTQHTAQQTERVLERLAVLEALIAAGDARIAALGRQLEALASTPAPAPAASGGYQVAMRLARTGASREELMSSCGLTQQEAELVACLHGAAQRTREHSAAA